MKNTQDQRFLEYAGIITSGKLQEREVQSWQPESKQPNNRKIICNTTRKY